jgi:ectoine hydroxylase-related dioxygenase (phytanoyl-CoA dioxygenase family)
MLNNLKENLKTLDEGAYCYLRRASSTTANDKVRELRKNGYVILDHLVGANIIDEVAGSLQKRIEEFKFRKPLLSQAKVNTEKHAKLIEDNFLLKRSELEKNGLACNINKSDRFDEFVKRERPATLEINMVDDNKFYDIWLDPELISIVKAYFGFTPLLSEAFIRRNYPSDFVVMNHGWHRDTNHATHLLKAFIFLNDCTRENGPHHFVSGSHTTQGLSNNSYFTEDQVNEFCGKEKLKKVISIVPKGTIILEDTRGLHKAGIPTAHYRDLGFATYMPDRLVFKRQVDYKISKKIKSRLSAEQQLFLSKST